MPKVGVGLPLALVIVVPRLPMYLTMNGCRGTIYGACEAVFARGCFMILGA